MFLLHGVPRKLACLIGGQGTKVPPMASHVMLSGPISLTTKNGDLEPPGPVEF